MKRKILVPIALSALLAVAIATTGARAPAATASPAAAIVKTFKVPAPILDGINLETATIPQLQQAMNEGIFTSVELTQFYLNRIALLNPVMHAVIGTNPSALAEARASDTRRLESEPRGPMEGIPVLLKDNIGTADLEGTAAGSYALIDAHPSHDAALVTRLRASGAVILGKANMSEWAGYRSTNGSSGWSAIGGQGENPYKYGYTPGGSSSGPGAAVAAALTQVAVGTETDGSIVCPSSVDGDVGIKPSLGLVSTNGVVPITKEQDVAGPIARNLTDAAILLGAIDGPHAQHNYTKYLNANAVKGMRIGVWRDMPEEPIEKSTMRVFNHAVKELQAMGATVVNITIPYLNIVDNNEFPAMAYEFKQDINAYLAATPGVHPVNLAGLIAFNKRYSSVEMKYFTMNIWRASQNTNGTSNPLYKRMRHAATTWAQRGINEVLAKDHLSAIVSPTENPAWTIPLGTGQGDPDNLLESSTPAAVSGYADLSVPMGYVGPLPVGMSVMAGDYSEPTLISIAYAFQQYTQVRKAPEFLNYPG